MKAFAHTAAYDAAITTYLGGETFPASLRLAFEKSADLRYGEKPASARRVLRGKRRRAGNAGARPTNSRHRAEFRQPLRFRRCLESGVRVRRAGGVHHQARQPVRLRGCEYSRGSVRQSARCRRGFALWRHHRLQPRSRWRTRRAKSSSRTRCITRSSRRSFPMRRWKILKNRSGWGADLRLLETETTLPKSAEFLDFKRVSGGLLAQDADAHELPAAGLKLVTERAPSDDETRDLLFAWKCVKHLKSNAIAVAKNGSLIGAGAGQMNRVSSVELALKQAGEKRARRKRWHRMRFFPFDDGPAAAAKRGNKQHHSAGRQQPRRRFDCALRPRKTWRWFSAACGISNTETILDFGLRILDFAAVAARREYSHRFSVAAVQSKIGNPKSAIQKSKNRLGVLHGKVEKRGDYGAAGNDDRFTARFQAKKSERATATDSVVRRQNAAGKIAGRQNPRTAWAIPADSLGEHQKNRSNFPT